MTEPIKSCEGCQYFKCTMAYKTNPSECLNYKEADYYVEPNPVEVKESDYEKAKQEICYDLYGSNWTDDTIFQDRIDKFAKAIRQQALKEVEENIKHLFCNTHYNGEPVDAFIQNDVLQAIDQLRKGEE